MAESGDSTSVSKTRDYESIVSATREISDPDRERSYIALIVAQNGSLLAADSKYKEVCIFNRNGKQVKTFSVGLSEEENILGITELSDGNIAVSGYGRGVIKVFTMNGEFVEEFDQGLVSGELQDPGGMAVNKDGQVFVMCDSKALVYDKKGMFQYSFECQGPGIDYQEGLTWVCIGSDDLVYVSAAAYNIVLVFQQNGMFVHSLGDGILFYPEGMAATNDSHLIVASSLGKKLSIFTTSGECVHEVEDVGLEEPTGVAVGDNGFIYVTDGSRICVF